MIAGVATRALDRCPLNAFCVQLGNFVSWWESGPLPPWRRGAWGCGFGDCATSGRRLVGYVSVYVSVTSQYSRAAGARVSHFSRTICGRTGLVSAPPLRISWPTRCIVPSSPQPSVNFVSWPSVITCIIYTRRCNHTHYKYYRFNVNELNIKAYACSGYTISNSM